MYPATYECGDEHHHRHHLYHHEALTYPTRIAGIVVRFVSIRVHPYPTILPILLPGHAHRVGLAWSRTQAGRSGVRHNFSCQTSNSSAPPSYIWKGRYQKMKVTRSRFLSIRKIMGTLRAERSFFFTGAAHRSCDSPKTSRRFALGD